mgnify:CR=1 FL=1
MAGKALTTRFMLGTATLMIGSMASLYDLKPSTDSVGLVKNLTIMADPTFLGLTQGSTNSTVFSKLTNNPVKLTAEVFEYTAKNLAYGLSLDGTGVVPLGTSWSPNNDVGVDQNSTSNQVDLPDGAGAIATVGSYIMFENPTSGDDLAQVRKVTAVDPATGAKDTLTFTPNLVGYWPAAYAKVTVVNAIDVGSTIQQPFLSAKAVGKLVDGTEVAILIPKVRITKGFTMAFNSEQYGNMPFEMEAMDLVSTDAFYADFKTRKAALHLV